MTGASTETVTRRRAGLTLAGIAIPVLGVLVVLAAVLIARSSTSPDPAGSEHAALPTRPVPSAEEGPGSGMSREETDLVTRPMVQLPIQAARPQALSTRVAGPAITVPRPAVTAGGFPRSPEGALGQLKALDENALAGGDPDAYRRGYDQLALPGSPPAGSTGLHALLRSFRSRAQLPGAGPVGSLTVTYEITHGLVKGVTSGDFAVVCVLGHFTADYQGQVVTAGVGDCQAMRWTGAGWRIAPGLLAAPAPSAWPGSEDAVRAGYRELR